MTKVMGSGALSLGLRTSPQKVSRSRGYEGSRDVVGDALL